MIHPKYAAATKKLLQNIKHESTNLRTLSGHVVTAKYKGVTLSLSVRGDGTVEHAWHGGAKDAERAILDALCDLAPERPVREVAEHGIIYVEHSMRDPQIAVPVPGLLDYENADPAFIAAAALIRDCYHQHRHHAKTADAEKNFWSPAPQAAWVNLTTDEKISKVKAAIQQIQTELNLLDPRFEVIQIEHNTRVVTHVTTTTMPGAKVGHAVMVLERELKKRIEPQIELILESIEDRNHRLGRTHIERATDTAPTTTTP